MRRLGHVPALDGVRGIAIVAVVTYHFFNVLAGGYFGVDLFFVLSGFLITTLLLEDGRLHRFYERRALRLLPALVPLLIVCQRLTSWNRIAEGGFYVANFFRAFGRDSLYDTPVDHLWSLAAEEQFYLLWPVLLGVLVVHRRRLTLAIAILFVALVCYRIGLAASGSSMRRLYYGPDTHADGLVLGCLAALVRPHVRRSLGRIALATVVAFFALGAWTVSWLAYGLPLFEIAAALVVLAAADSGLPELTLRPLVWLGLISYSLYLWHQPARFIVGKTHPWVGLPFALLLALGSYRLVEQRFRRGRRTSVHSPLPQPVADA